MNTTRRTRISFLEPLVLLMTAAVGHGGVIDFEQVNSVVPIEGLVISTQYRANFGISFRRRESADLFPVIARYGPPEAAFTLGNGANDTLTIPNAADFGNFFLTDDPVSGTSGTGIILDFVGPVSQASGYLLDVDGKESVTVIAYGDSAGTLTLDTKVFNAGAPGTGDGKAALWSFSRASREIWRVDIISNNAGIGYDNFSSDYEPPPQAVAEMGIRMLPQLTIKGDVGRPYRLEYADLVDLTPAGTNWHNLATIFLPNSPYLYVDRSATNATRRFYRVESAP